MKQELHYHLIPLLILFVFIFAIWLFNQVAYYEFISLLLGFAFGSFFLDLDHLIYWFYLEPKLEESRLAQAALKNRDHKSILKLLEITHQNHVSLVFHHYFFQIVLVLVSFFIFTSSSSIFVMAFLLALNIHLLVDEFVDFQKDPPHLQTWLFAREKKQLTLKSLQYYLFFFLGLTILFVLLLINSRS